MMNGTQMRTGLFSVMMRDILNGSMSVTTAKRTTSKITPLSVLNG